MAVDVPLPHLDRPFDYAIPEEFAGQVAPGCRVKVRFAGRQRDGFVLDVLERSDSDRELSPLLRVISPEPVLRPEIVQVVRAVADHYAGTFADVVRLAVPPRHGLTETAERPPYPAPEVGRGRGSWSGIRTGPVSLGPWPTDAPPGPHSAWFRWPSPPATGGRS